MNNWLKREEIELKRKSFLNNIDPYVDYIDSLSQYEAAKARNMELSNLVSFCKGLLSELDSLSEKLAALGFNGDIEYSRGYFRIKVNGVYKYRRCGISYKN